MQVCLVLGTRPEIIKMAPIVRVCQKSGVTFSIVHTNQHYSPDMNAVFFEDLELPPPDANLGIRAETHGAMTGRMVEGIEGILMRDKPAIVLAVGDTNSVLAAALASSKLGIPLGHIEAGLRSYDRTMPEESNRIVADHIASLLFAPTERSRENLSSEGIKDNVFVTGNTIVDAVEDHRKLAEKKSNALKELSLTAKNYTILTMHRPATVDEAAPLRSVMEGIGALSAAGEIIFPAHPRTKNKIREFGIEIPANVRMIEPLGYLDMLMLLSNARLVLTDSGGLQEEACILRVPCVTLRENTERPETIDVGANVLAGSDGTRIASAAATMLDQEPVWHNPFGEYGVGARIVDIVRSKL